MSGARDCPRWDGCSAPICPLDPDWRQCQHLAGERVCGMLCELVKHGGQARLRARLSGMQVATLVRVAPQVTARWERVRMQLQRSARSGSRMAAGQRLARATSVTVSAATCLPPTDGD